MDMKAFGECMDADKYVRFIEQDFLEGKTLGVEETPTIFINGEQYKGEMTADEIITTINELLNEGGSQS